MVWILLVLLYGVFKGFREIAKKKAMEENSVMEILFFYSLIAFVFIIPTAGDAFEMQVDYIWLIFLKSLVIFVAWILGFEAIKKMPISTYGVLDLSRVLFSTFFGVTVLNESLGFTSVLGIVLVGAGLLLLKYQPGQIGRRRQEGKEWGRDAATVTPMDAVEREATTVTSVDVVERETTTVTPVVVLAAFGSCFLNALSGLMDKLFMRDVTSSQLQFWYMLYLVLLYLAFILIRRIPLRLSALKNKWILVLSILFVIADKALFVANSYPESRITVMTLLKQAGCIVTILAGRYIFKEKNTGFKLVCAAIIIAGIVVGTI